MQLERRDRVASATAREQRATERWEATPRRPRKTRIADERVQATATPYGRGGDQERIGAK